MAVELPFPLSAQVTHASLGLVTQGGLPKWVVLYEECRSDYCIERPSGLRVPAVEIIVAGEGTLFREGAKWGLRPGRFFTSPPGCPVSFVSSAPHPLKKYFLAPLVSEAWRGTWWERLPLSALGEHRNPLLVAGLLETLLEMAQSHDPEAPERAFTLLSALGSMLFEDMRRATTAPQVNALVDRALRYLQHHLPTTSSVEIWASALGVTPNHLCRVFRSSGMRTPYNELIERKMRYAYQRLAVGEVSVTAVAQELGYADPFHFSRLFRRRMGVPPSHVRHATGLELWPQSGARRG